MLLIGMLSAVHFAILKQRKTEYNEKLIKMVLSNAGPAQGGTREVILSVPTLFISIHDALFSTLSLGIHVQLPSSPYMVLNRLSIVCACFLTFSLL